MHLVTASYDKLPDGAIPDAAFSAIALALSDESVLNPYNINLFTEAVTEQLALKPPSGARPDDQYIYYVFTVVLELALTGHASATGTEPGMTRKAIQMSLSNPSFRDWVCEQPFFQDIRSNIEWFFAKLSGRKTSSHIRTHAQNSFRTSVVEPMLYFLYTDRSALSHAVKKSLCAQYARKKHIGFRMVQRVQTALEELPNASPEKMFDDGLELSLNLAKDTREFVHIRPNTLGVFFDLVASPKPNELVTALTIHGLTSTSLAPMIYAKPNVKDLTVRSVTTMIGAYTGQTVLCTVVAHSVLAVVRQDIVPSRTDRKLIEISSVVQHSAQNLSTQLQEESIVAARNLGDIFFIAKKCMSGSVQSVTAMAIADVFYADTSHMMTAMYTPYLMEHVGFLLSDHWQVLQDNPFEFNHKSNAVILQLTIGTVAQLTLKNGNSQFATAILVTPFALSLVQKSTVYQATINRMWTGSGEAHPLVKKAQRAWAAFSITKQMAGISNSQAFVWGNRIITLVGVGAITCEIHLKRPQIERVKEQVVSAASTGLRLYGAYYRIGLMKNVIGGTLAPMIELVSDPSNLSKFTGVAAATAVHYASDSPLAAAAVGQGVEALCESYRVFDYRNLQARASVKLIQAKAYSMIYADQAKEKAVQVKDWTLGKAGSFFGALGSIGSAVRDAFGCRRRRA